MIFCCIYSTIIICLSYLSSVLTEDNFYKRRRNIYNDDYNNTAITYIYRNYSISKTMK